MTTMKVYRSGSVCVHDHTPFTHFVVADELRPAGFPSRSRSIYASPSLAGVARWVWGRYPSFPDDVAVHEITVNDDVYVFNVNEWERAVKNFGSYCSREEKERSFADYWNSVTTLEELEGLDSNPSDWEILLREEDVISEHEIPGEIVLSSIASDYIRSRVASFLGLETGTSDNDHK